MEPFAEIVEALGGEGIVVPLPGELCLDVSTRAERLHSLDDLYTLQEKSVSQLPCIECDCELGLVATYVEVSDFRQFRVSWLVVVFRSDHDSLCIPHVSI
jgi:hypothetical protein